jgi:hypothetical protein
MRNSLALMDLSLSRPGAPSTPAMAARREEAAKPVEPGMVRGWVESCRGAKWEGDPWERRGQGGQGKGGDDGRRP